VRTICSMLRAVLIGLLAVSATSSCSGGGDTAKVAPGAVAGKVIEASGSVAATRGGSSRALAAGAEVFADDVIDTANGSVLILLHHNNARWAVESGQRTRVDESLAWKLAKQDGPTKRVDHTTSAAGREGERTAADTRATSAAAERGGAPPTADEGQAMPAAPMAPTAPAAVPSPSAPVTGGTKGEAGGGASGASGAGGVGGANGGAENRARSDERAEESKQAGRPEAPRGAARNLKGAPEQDPPPPAGLVATPEARLRGELAARRDELRRCFTDKLTRKLTVRVAKGALTIELAGAPADAKGRACLERVVQQISLAGLTASALIELGPS
jgi:hypothetical protein